VVALSDIELLKPSVDTILQSVDMRHRKVIEALETSASSNLVNGLRIIRLQRTIVAIGVFSLFEALLQHQMGWDRPFDRLRECLETLGRDELAGLVEDYWLAINVLKHGRGPSHDKLMSRSEDVEFAVKPEDDFFVEGDVSEGQPLVDVDSRFVERCAEIVAEAVAAVNAAS